MSILAVYEDSELQQPRMVLTHLEDIVPRLSEVGVRLEAVPLPGTAGMTSDAELIEACSRLCTESMANADLPFRQLLDLPYMPAYAEVSEAEIAPEHSHGRAGFRLFVCGRATLCLHHGNSLLALACAPGDLLLLPARLKHWAIPVPGERCRVLQFGTSVGDLQALPSGSSLARVFLPLEL